MSYAPYRRHENGVTALTAHMAQVNDPDSYYHESAALHFAKILEKKIGTEAYQAMADKLIAEKLTWAEITIRLKDALKELK